MSSASTSKRPALREGYAKAAKRIRSRDEWAWRRQSRYSYSKLLLRLDAMRLSHRTSRHEIYTTIR
jgi:hypothetical protein